MASSTNVTAAIILQAIVPNETNLSTTTTVAASSSSLDRSGYSRVEVVFISIVLVSIIVGTIVGNVLVCVAVCLVRKLRRPCNYLLVSLAVSDLCVAILVMPMATFYEVHGRWIFGEIICNLWVSIDVLSCTASILNLCMISVDRYYAITKPLEYGVKRTPRRMILWVILVWCFAACISLPPLLILGNEHWEESEDGDIRYDVCLVSQNFGYQLYATMCSFYIPLAVMMVVYYKIFRAARRIVHEEKRAQSHLESHCYLEISVKNGGGPPENKISSQSPSPANPSRGNHRSSSGSTNTMCSFDRTTLGRCFKSRHSNESQCPMLSMKPSSKPNQKNASKSATTHILPHLKTSPSNTTTQKKLRFQLAKERKASTTLGIIMSAFTFCWLPFFVLALVRPFLEATNALKTLATLFLWLGYANSLLNPIIYATLNRDFRKPFQAILYCRCGSLNNMMREEFYHSQYGDPDHHINRLTVDYEEGVEYIEAEGDQIKLPETDAAAHESFL